MQRLELKIPPVVQVLVTGALMWALAMVVPGLGFAFAFSGPLAAGLGAMGVAFALLGVWEFRSAGTTVDPRSPDQAASLVVGGVYRFSRNPMYVGFLLVLGAWGISLGNLASLVLLPVFVVYMNRFQIIQEERYMREKFGDAYRRYESEVRRWI